MPARLYSEIPMLLDPGGGTGALPASRSDTVQSERELSINELRRTLAALIGQTLTGYEITADGVKLFFGADWLRFNEPWR